MLRVGAALLQWRTPTNRIVPAFMAGLCDHSVTSTCTKFNHVNVSLAMVVWQSQVGTQELAVIGLVLAGASHAVIAHVHGRGSATPDVCESRRSLDVAILSISGSNLPTLDLATVTECEAACCQNPACIGWTYTPSLRQGCSKYGCCFLKSGSEKALQEHVKNDPGYTSGCIGKRTPSSFQEFYH